MILAEKLYPKWLVCCRSRLRIKIVRHDKLQWALFWTELWNIFNNAILELKSIVKLTHWKNCQLNKDQIFIKENELNYKFSLKFGHFLQYSVLHMNISLEKKKKSKFKGNFCKPFNTHYHNFGSLSSCSLMPKGSSPNSYFTDAFVWKRMPSRLLSHDGQIGHTSGVICTEMPERMNVCIRAARVPIDPPQTI